MPKRRRFRKGQKLVYGRGKERRAVIYRGAVRTGPADSRKNLIYVSGRGWKGRIPIDRRLVSPANSRKGKPKKRKTGGRRK